MTFIGVQNTSFQVEDRSWLLSQWGQGPGENPSCVLDVSTFTKNTHYPNGYFPSGIPVGKITAASTADKLVVGPYDNAASDGRETCIGFLHSATKVPDMADTGKDVGGALVQCGFVKEARLPVAIDTAGKADLKLVIFS